MVERGFGESDHLAVSFWNFPDRRFGLAATLSLVVLPQNNSPPPPAGAQIAHFPSVKRSDAALVADAARGDREAIATIWDRYSGLVRGIVYGALGPDQAIEDLTQEVFLAFIRGASRMKDGAALRGYLASMAVRQAAQEIRRRKVRRLVGLSSTGDLPECPTPPADSEGRMALVVLHQILDQLSHRRRMAFILRHVQGLEMLEAAQAMGVSESTLRRDLSAARSFIKSCARTEPTLADLIAKSEGSWS